MTAACLPIRPSAWRINLLNRLGAADVCRGLLLLWHPLLTVLQINDRSAIACATYQAGELTIPARRAILFIRTGVQYSAADLCIDPLQRRKPPIRG